MFRTDGRVSHADCPPVMCSVCSRSIRPDEPIRRDGEQLVHGNCWVCRYRTQRRATEGAAAYSDVAFVIRDRIAAGALPTPENGKDAVWAGHGSGRACDGCEKAIPSSEAECEAQAGGRALRFHRACLIAWQAQVRTAPPAIGGGSAASPWTVVFGTDIARRVSLDDAAYDELLLAGLEAKASCRQARERSVAERAASRRLRSGAQCLRSSSAALKTAARGVVPPAGLSLPFAGLAGDVPGRG